MSLFSPRNFHSHANSSHGESPDTPTPPLSPENFPPGNFIPPREIPFSQNGNHSTWGRNFEHLTTRDSPYDRTRDRPFDPIRSRDLIARKSRDETFDQPANFNQPVKPRVKLERIDDNQFDNHQKSGNQFVNRHQNGNQFGHPANDNHFDNRHLNGNQNGFHNGSHLSFSRNQERMHPRDRDNRYHAKKPRENRYVNRQRQREFCEPSFEPQNQRKNSSNGYDTNKYVKVLYFLKNKSFAKNQICHNLLF